MNCLICGREFDRFRTLFSHVSRGHKVSIEEYLKKYGVECNFNIPEIRENALRTISENIEAVNKKRKETNLKKYGSECNLHSKEGSEKSKKTWLKKYGVDHPLKSKIIKEKVRETCMKRYGVASPFQSQEVKEKTAEAFFKKYGVRYWVQDQENFSKRNKSLFSKKNYILPSGRTIVLMGYEPLFLDYIFKKNLLREEDIDYKPKRVRYIGYDGFEHYYFPDFYITKFNLILEIKSDWTEKQDKNLKLKEKACIDRGFKYLRIINNNFEKFEQLLRLKSF